MLRAVRYPIVPMVFDRSAMDLMILPQSRCDKLRALFRGMGMSHGDVARCIDLAFRCAEQCLRDPMPIGSRVAPNDGRGPEQIVVGFKPGGFRERTARRTRGDSCREFYGGWEETLLWTVDPSVERPGISQSPMADWKRI